MSSIVKTMNVDLVCDQCCAETVGKVSMDFIRMEEKGGMPLDLAFTSDEPGWTLVFEKGTSFLFNSLCPDCQEE